MKIKKQDLQTALEIVKPGLANKEIIEQSSSFAFLGDRVVTYNDAISIAHPIEGLELTGAVRAEELYEFLRRSKDPEIQIKITENEVLLKVGRSKVGLVLQSEIVLPLNEVDAQKEWHDLPEEFTHDLMFIKDCTSRDMSRPVLACVHITENRFEASDGFQIMRVFQSSDIPWPLGNYLIPAEHISEINKIEPTQVTESEGWLHFRNPTGTELSCRVMVDKFPDTDEHFNVKGQKIQFPKTMSEILDRVMVFTKKDHFMDEEIQIKLQGKKLTVEGGNDYGRFEEQAPVKFKGKDARFSITPSLLQNILKRSSTGVLGSKKIKFESTGWEYIAVLKEN